MILLLEVHADSCILAPHNNGDMKKDRKSKSAWNDFMLHQQNLITIRNIWFLSCTCWQPSFAVSMPSNHWFIYKILRQFLLYLNHMPSNPWMTFTVCILACSVLEVGDGLCSQSIIVSCLYFTGNGQYQNKKHRQDFEKAKDNLQHTESNPFSCLLLIRFQEISRCHAWCRV